MGCCNILTGYTPPRFPPSLNDYPLYIDRLHKEVWYWTGSSWELVWQVSIAGAGTLGVVKVSPSSPITIDAEGNLDIDCGRLKTQCKLATKADIDAAIATITTTINTILTRLGDLETKITNLTVTVTDLGRRITIVEGAVTNINGVATDVTKLKADVARLDDPDLTAAISSMLATRPMVEFTANAPYSDVVLRFSNSTGPTSFFSAQVYLHDSAILKTAVWKQLPNNRETVTIRFALAANLIIHRVPTYAPKISSRGSGSVNQIRYSAGYSVGSYVRILLGPATTAPTDWEQYLPDCAVSASINATSDNVAEHSNLDVVLVKHKSLPSSCMQILLVFDPNISMPLFLSTLP